METPCDQDIDFIIGKPKGNITSIPGKWLPPAHNTMAQCAART